MKGATFSELTRPPFITPTTQPVTTQQSRATPMGQPLLSDQARTVAQSAATEEDACMPLSWERMDSKQCCRIAAYLDGSILDSAEQHEQLIAQCAKILPKLVGALDARTIQALQSEEQSS